MKVNEIQLLHLAFLAKSSAKKSGYLDKKSGKKIEQGPVKWQSRWCVLYYNFLFYYENNVSQRPQGVIFLEGIETSQFELGTVPCFSIRIPGDGNREYLFGCSSIAEQHEWVNLISTSSAFSIWERNHHLALTVQDLEHHLQSIKEEKEKLRKELSDHYSQVSRLKLELSSVKGNKRHSLKSRKISITSTATLRFDGASSNSTSSISDAELTPDELAKLIKLQNAVRSWLLRRRWKGLIQSYISTFTADKLKKRNKLLWQFITAEEDYVQQMNVLVTIFLHPMKQDAFYKKSITSAEVSKIFTNSESILVLHKIFVEGMSLRMKNWPAVHIDDLLFALVAAVPIYMEYIKNHPDALKTLAECKKRADFVKMLNWCESKEECHGQTIEQFLLYPVRAMPTYIRNIYDILEVTPENHSERKSLESILFKLQEAQSYNHYLDEGESIRHTLEIERLIDGGCLPLLDGNQQFIRHGVLKQVGIEPRFPSGRREKIRHCFLFSQHLIVGSRTMDGRLRLSKKSGIIPLMSTSLVEEVTGSEYPDHVKNKSFKLVVEIPIEDTDEIDKFDIVLMANKSNEKTLWTTDISQCIYNLALEEGPDETDIEDSSKKPDQNEEGKVEGEKVEISPYSILLKDDQRLRDNSKDIEYSEEVSGPYHLPQIMHASVDRLIERLADPRLPGAEFMETFLLTYRAFTTSEVVLKGLIEAYWKVMGGYPTPKKSHSPERKKLAVSRSISSQGIRHRLRSVLSNASDASSTDDLDASFNSGISPGASTTVFNYNTLKDQLNSPAKRSVATNKWCEDSAAVTALDKRETIKPRSASANNIAIVENHHLASMEKRKVSRSQSIEVLVNKQLAKEQLVFQSAVNSKSCEQLDDVSFDENNTVNILNIVREEGNSLNYNNRGDSNRIESDIENSLVNGHDQNFSMNEHDRKLSVNNESSTLNDNINYEANSLVEQESNQLNSLEEYESNKLKNLEEHGSSKTEDITDNESFKMNDLENHKSSTTNDLENHHPSSLSHNISLSDSIADVSTDNNTVFGNSYVEELSISMLEDVEEEENHHHHVVHPESFDSVDLHPISVATASYDDSSMDDGRRSTMESQSTSHDDDSISNTEKSSPDNCSIGRSITMDSVNSFESSEKSIDEQSVSSNTVSHSQSDELICKQRNFSDMNNLGPKSSSMSEKKSGISPYFRRKKKGSKKESKKQKQTKLRSGSEPRMPDEPVLISIRETGDGKISIEETKPMFCEEFEPVAEKTMEVMSVPIPVPVAVEVKKPSPSNTPKRKRSLFQTALKKFPVKRASSEQNLFLQSPVHSMRPAMSTMSLDVNGNAGGPKHSPGNNHLDYEMATRSLERKKNSSFIRDKFHALTNAYSASDLDLRPGMDGKNSLKKDKKRLTLKILSASPKEQSPVAQSNRRKTSVFDQRPQMVTRKSISVNRGPLKIMSIFKHWIAKHPKDFLTDPLIFTTAENFFVEIKNDERTLPVVKEIVASLEKSLMSHRKSLAAVHPFDELLLQQHSLRNTQEDGIDEQDELDRCTALHHHSPNVVAANMTLLEHYLYSKISFNEFVSCQWTKKDKELRAPGIMKFINRFNHVTNIISYSVVHGQSPHTRANLIEFWINTAAHCRDYNNFNACVEIVSALNASAVHRLKKSWEQVSKPLREVFNDLDSLVSAERSFKHLREAVHMCNPPCVPYLGSYLSDLLFAHEGGKTFNENGLVNFAKMCRVSRLVREVKCYQQLPYTLELNQEVAFALVNWDIEVNEDELYEQSLIAEPRQPSK